MLALKPTLVAAFLVAWMTGAGAVAAKTPSKRLVFEGTVTSLRTGVDEFRPWIVTVMVEKVIAGEFSEPMYQFAVHSPARAGLVEGESYTIEAIWRKTGYETRRWTRSPAKAENCTVRPANMCRTRTITSVASLPRLLAAERRVVSRTKLDDDSACVGSRAQTSRSSGGRFAPPLNGSIVGGYRGDDVLPRSFSVRVLEGPARCHGGQCGLALSGPRVRNRGSAETSPESPSRAGREASQSVSRLSHL